VSFRLRALALVMLIAATAAAATGWLVLRQASSQVREAAAAGRQEVQLVTTELRTYGLTHGGWDGLPTKIGDLAERTGQRIRVVDYSGAVVADTDLLAGHAARSVVGPPILVDPLPALQLPDNQTPTMLVRLSLLALIRYRTALAQAACLAAADVPVTVRTGSDGMPEFTPAAGHEQDVARCAAMSPVAADPQAAAAAMTACQATATELVVPCLQQAFSDQIERFAPRRLQVFLGAVDETDPPLAVGPAVVAAVTVTVVVVLVALLLSRAVLRPINALTAASRRLGAGDLHERVRVTGRDEIAELGHAFNKMADSLQAAEDSQRRLISDVAHELRTPLANVRGYIEALQDRILEPGPELLDSLHQEVLLQQRIVEDLQVLALAEANALTYIRVDIELDDMLRACAAAHRLLADAAGVALAVETSVPVTVRADPDRLRQALGNVITNAVRATKSGGRVGLRLTHDAGTATVRVIDTGCGIAARDLPHVFERFWRADAARGRATGGSGLGLAIARQIVLDHGGAIDVTSTVDVGTTFTILLPVISAGSNGDMSRRV
jgi:two-component system, OmpR family, sensor histidine kinase BaeS